MKPRNAPCSALRRCGILLLLCVGGAPWAWADREIQTNNPALLARLVHQPVVIAEVSERLMFVGILEGVNTDRSAIARLKGVLPRAAVPEAFWRDATQIPGARVVQVTAQGQPVGELLLVDALVNDQDLAFAEYADEFPVINKKAMVHLLQRETFDTLKVKVLIQRDRDGTWGCLLPDDPQEFLRKAREIGL